MTVKEGKGILQGGSWNGRDLEEIKGLYLEEAFHTIIYAFCLEIRSVRMVGVKQQSHKKDENKQTD